LDLILNPGAQTNFVTNDHRASAFVGGVGSGKTFALLAKGLILAQQPKRGFWGPRGCVAAINYPVLKDVVLPQFLEMVEGTGLLLKYLSSEKKALMVPYNDAGEPDPGLVKKRGGTWVGASEILFRSLDQPNWMRGLELSWFGIDEGRHLEGGAWDVLWGRLRQKGYTHRGFVCSTPNGFDWMWQKFHPDSQKRLGDAVWFGSPTHDNARNLEDDYIPSLEATYAGRFLRQEVYGEFVGVVTGAVFFEFDMTRHVRSVNYDPTLPLYSFWDFGMGDLGTCVFAQVKYETRGPVEVASLRILDALEATDRTSAEWSRVFKDYCEKHYGKLPELNICDPAGRQRSISTGRSIVQDFAAQGVRMSPAPKKPIEYAVSLLNNMLAGDRVVIAERADRVAAAFASHKWPLNAADEKAGTKPVHDWSSHYADAVRYGVTQLLQMAPKKVGKEEKKAYSPDQWGYIRQQMLRDDDGKRYLGDSGEPEILWEPAALGRPT
jgi:hypothetical protein